MPQTFGRYELLEVLGRGGMGEVHRARDTVRQREVALKLLPEHLAGDERFLARFRRESRLAAQLSDPHIIPIHDFGEVDGRLFIDMRLVLGADLGSLIDERGPLDVVVAVDILGQVASALDAAHADGLIHRDVKPSNVMLTGLTADLGQRPPFAYLVDFGIARSTTQMTALTDTSSATIGTVAYMPPERINGEVGDGRGDVYALACVLFETLTGAPPFEGELVPLIFQHMNAVPPRASERVPAVPRALDAVIAKGLAKDPEQRFRTAGELALAARQALRGAAADVPPPPPPQAPPAPRPSPGPRPRPQPTGTARPGRTEPAPPPAPADTRATRVESGTWPPEPVAGGTTPSSDVEPPPPAETVTLLWADLAGATRPRTAGSAQIDALLAGRRRVVQAACEQHGGAAVGDTAVGDTLLVAFRDGPAAAAAAADAQRGLAELEPGGAGSPVGIGLHAGQPRPRGDGYWGPEVGYVARLGAAARGGQVLVSDAARQLAPEHGYEALGRHSVADFPTPQEIFHLVVDGSSADDVAPPRTLDAPSTNLPSTPGPLIGRGSELDDLVGRLSRGQRLVTLTGPAGSGRTRLAVEVADVLAARFESVWFVALELAPRDGGVLPAVAHALGLPERDGVDLVDRLLEVVHERRVLFVLDGAEGPDGAAEIDRLVAGSPGLHALVTGAAPLGVAAEHVVRLGALALPGEPVPGTEGAHAVAEFTSAPAAQLLLDRAAAAGAAIPVDPATVDALARLCRRLAGLPLALELVAARLPGSDAGALLEQLDAASGAPRADSPALPAELRAVLDWTVGLLRPAERHLLVALAGFADSFSLASAESAFGVVFDELAALVEAGLVRSADDGRFVLRPPVRSYAAGPAAADGDTLSGPRAVAGALARVAERVEPLWLLAEGEGRLLLRPEQANVLAALDRTREQDPQLHLRLAASTAWLLDGSGLASTSRAHLQLALERAGDDRRSQARCRQALGILGRSVPQPGSPDPGDSVAAADLWRELGDADHEATSLAQAASLYVRRHEGVAALAAVDRAAALAMRCSDPDGMATLLGLLRAGALGALGRHDEARAVAHELSATTGPGSFLRLWALGVTADLALDDGRPAEALAGYGAALPLVERYDTELGALMLAGRIGAALVDLDRHDDAAAVLAICVAVHRELAWPVPPEVDARVQQVQAKVDPTRLATARARAASYRTAEALTWVGRLARGEAEQRARRAVTR